MQTGQSSFAPDATRAAASVPYFLPAGAGGIPPGNVDIQGNLGVTGDAVIDGALTVGVTTSLINLAGPGNLIGAGPANITIASDASIGITPGPGFSVNTDGPLNSSGVVTSRLGNAQQISLHGAGIATIPNNSTFITVPFTGMTATGKILATITGNFNGVTALSVVPSINEFYIYAPVIPTNPTNVMWMVIGLS